MRAGVLPDRYGRAVTLSGVTSDVTDRKAVETDRESLLEALAIEREHTQQALRGEKAFSGLLMSSVPAGIVAYDHELAIATWNPVMERLVGLTEREVVGRRLSEVIAEDVMEAMRPRVEKALGGEAGPIEELEFASEHGPSLWLETQHAPLSGGDGQIAGGVAFFRDVTERRRAEEQLRQAQKMETIGQLTGGVAHDFNNLLAAVLGNLELLAKKIPPEPALQRHIDGAMQGARRGASLTQRLLAFARRQDLKPEPTDLSSLLEGMRALMERSLGPLIAIDYDIEDGLPPATVDPNQLELAVLNLAVNARDAMPEGGQLVIRLDKREPRRSLGLFGSYVRLCVEDSGEGMDAETLQRAIEPFFSTKELGKGTGLGLSMVHGLAVQLGGALNLYSEVGRGTIAELWLPVSAGPIEHVKEPVAMNEAAPRSRILVVDDDALIAMNTVDMVEDLGHTVLEAYSGKQALEILQSDAEIDAIITDYAMPGMTGVELANRAREIRPGLPILLATGYADLPSGTTTDLPRLGKPYQQRDLSEQLSRLLTQREASAGG
ncbi:PAS domain S-box protein [Arsenicitalea aurantiaca]|uniref:histidine kinase n=2 Tax=Arsenicitalea aurantiaca TaxID=1783274 RepID=A0A433X8Q5_9HYPH|nr:PAS domain S-box protein [Arsenicitalea aurantiaca]